MNWFTIATLRRGAIIPYEQLQLEDELRATGSLFKEQGLGAREWSARWDLINATPEERFA
jgi:hypothetical protein